MNIMTITKNQLIKIIIFLFVLSITITTIIILNNRNSKMVHFLNYPTNYSICNTQDFEVIIYADSKNLECFKDENINNIKLSDIDENIYHVNLNSINIKERVLVDDKYYFPYFLNLSMSFLSDSIVKMNDVKLIVTLKNSNKIVFNIGNISVINSEFEMLTSIKSITSTTKKIDDYYTLDTIKVELNNKQYHELILSNIILVSNVVNTDKQVIKLGVGEDYILDIKLNYLENGFIDHVGIILVWENNGRYYNQLISPYRLFKTTSSHTKPLIQKYEVY